MPVSPLRQALRDVTRGRRLSREATRAVFEAMLEGPAESGEALVTAGLLTALAARGESPDELAGAVDALRARCSRLSLDEGLAARAIDVCGTGGDGLGTFNVSTVTAFVVAGAGVPVAKHGNRAVSSSCGSADVLDALGVRIDMSAAHAAEALGRAGVTFLFAPLYHPAMKAMAQIRRDLGVRTLFNLAGPLGNPAGVRRQIVGVDRPERVETMGRALAMLGVERAFVFSNEAGGDELLPFGRTRLATVEGKEVTLSTVSATDFGLAEGEPEHLGGGDAERNAEIVHRILDGETGTARETVLMNAAAALVVAGIVSDFRDGVAVAARSIDERAALRALKALVAISNAEGVEP